jgi:capsular polysaccharide biosynthesis protein
MMSLAAGVALILMLDFLKGPIRHESDITDAVHRPIYGSIPSL